MELKPLSQAELVRILKEPEFNMIRQQTELLKTENVEVTFTDDGLQEIARGDLYS